MPRVESGMLSSLVKAGMEGDPAGISEWATCSPRNSALYPAKTGRQFSPNEQGKKHQGPLWREEK